MQVVFVGAFNVATPLPSHAMQEMGGSGQAYSQLLREAYRRSPEDRNDVRYAPLIAEEFRHFPPAFIVVAECDAFCDEGRLYADKLRASKEVVAFVHAFFEAGKPVAAICHAPWTLVEADVVKGRTLTSFPSLQTDIRNAGGNWVDQEVVVDKGLVTSRNPDDLPAFCAKLIEEVAEGRHAEQAASA